VKAAGKKAPEKEAAAREQGRLRSRGGKADAHRAGEENSEDDGWILSSKLAELLNRKLPDFDVRNFRFKKFTRFVESLQVFEAKRQASEGEQVHTIYFRVKEVK
jgi:Fe-S-cluster formation regulator IscX/YfhJ